MRHRFAAEFLESRLLLSDGDVDLSFGTNGRTTMDFTVPADDYPSSIAMLSDGRFLVGHNSFAGSSSDVGAFSRHLANGQLDTTFGGGTGKVRLGDGWGTLGIDDMFVRTGGEIIALGSGGTGLAAVRAFSADGVVLPTSSFNFPTSGIGSTRTALLGLPGGGGYLLTTVAIHKFNPNGSLDSSFGSGGTLSFPTVSGVAFRGAGGLAADSTGALFIAGYNSTIITGVRQPAVAKITTGGAFATGWGTNGVLPFTTLGTDGDVLSSVVVDSSNRPIVAGTDMGTTFDRAMVARLTTTGGLDGSFNSVGTRFFNPPAGSDASGADLRQDSTGRIVFAGLYLTQSGGAPTYFLSRINPTTGALDTSFAGDGIQESLLPASAGVQIWYGPPVIDSSNNIVMGIGTRVTLQNTDGASTIFRINGSNGQRDTAFGPAGGNGTTPVHFVGSADNRTTAATRQSDGKLLFAGYATAGGVAGWLVGRLNENGTPDTSFGPDGNGTIRIDWGAISQIPNDIEVDSEGRIVIVGWVATTTSSDTDIALARLTSAGLPDSSWGTTGSFGRARYAVGPTDEVGSSVAFQSDGKLIVSGWTEDTALGSRRSSVLRFNSSNGSIDTTFGVAGRRVFGPASDGDSIATDVFVRPDDSILTGGNEDLYSTQANRRFAAKLTPGGAMDTNYGTAGSGIAYASTFAEDIWIGSCNVTIDADGRLYVPGTLSLFDDVAMITRFTPGGVPDLTFGTNGTASITLKSSSDSFGALGIDPSGRPVIGASNRGLPTPNGSDLLLIRLDATGRRDTTFGQSGERVVDVAGRGDSAVALTFTSDGKMVVLGESTTPSTGLDFSAVRLINDPAVKPAWLAPDGVWGWNPTTKTLTVSGTATIIADPAADLPVINVTGPAAALTINPPSSLTVRAAALNLTNNAAATLASLGPARTASNHRVLVTNSLNVDGTSRLDLADNDLVVDYSGASPVAGIEADVRSAYNVVGDWAGKGVTSSLAAADGNFTVAIADNALLPAPFGTAQGGPLFAGVNVDLTTVLIKFTHRADLNLDGLITPDDSAIFGGNYDETQPATWATGDLNYDGLFTPDDSAIFGGSYDETLPLI